MSLILVGSTLVNTVQIAHGHISRGLAPYVRLTMPTQRLEFFGEEARDFIHALPYAAADTGLIDARYTFASFSAICSHNWQTETYYTGDPELGEEQVAHTGRYCTSCNTVQREGEF